MDVLAKGCPLDFHPRAFTAGACAQSLFGHVNVLICKRDDIPTFTLMVARSLGRDVWHALCEAAAQYGYDLAKGALVRGTGTSEDLLRQLLGGAR